MIICNYYYAYTLYERYMKCEEKIEKTSQPSPLSTAWSSASKFADLVTSGGATVGLAVKDTPEENSKSFLITARFIHFS